MSDKKRKILLIEPDEYLVRVMARRLESLGFDVLFTTEPSMVQGIMQAGDIDLVIIEPHHKYVEDFFVELKTLSSDYSKIKIFVLTKDVDKQQAEKIASLGIDEYAIKQSVTMDEVISKIRLLLE